MPEKQFPPSIAAAAGHRAAVEPEQLEALALAMLRETLVLRELIEALSEQRAAVAKGEVPALNEITNRIAAIIADLDAARSHRRELMLARGAEDAGTALRGPNLPADVAVAFGRVSTDLVKAAREANQGLAINRRVLERALERRESLMRTVFAAAEENSGVYRAPDARPELPEPGAVFVNKVA